MVFQKKCLDYSTMNIGLLVTDDDPNHGGEQGIAKSKIGRICETIPKNGLTGDTINVVVTPFFVCLGEFPRNYGDFDGFIITGSHYSVNDELPWMLKLEEFIRNLYKDQAAPKLFAICFGHQLTAKAFGGKIGKNPSGKFIWCSGRVDVDTTLSEKMYYKNALGDTNQFHIMQSHYEQVLEAPICGKTVGTSPGECEHEVLLYDDKIITMQGHPELTIYRMRNEILPVLRQFGKVSAAEEDFAIESFENTNGDQLMHLIFNFFQS